MSDSEEEYSYDEDMEVTVEEPPAGVTGLALAEHYFGPLLSPIAATPANWTAYTEHRRGANAEYKNVFHRRKRSISDSIAPIEVELGLENGTLRQCICILDRLVERDDVNPRNADALVRIYSPAAPKYIDVHIKYHCRSRFYEIEWFYSLGYKIYNRISGSPTDYLSPSLNGSPSLWHCRGGWQSICWGFFDDKGNYGPKWHRSEVADMGLHEEGVLDVHEALFGPIETPPRDDADALLAYRRKLVATVRLLFAALGIDYGVACTEDETDERPYDFMLEGLADKWVGIRAACGFQLSSDAEAARRGKEERRY
ncbi:hypothetical protein JVT61DRAFT_4733 [Boletus reticuloceps]|uniref:Uncharacterized protein n=1 Tax=Boletus reticuloceps TaxID=495285 RepID=A0A8I3A909_9AGAM|nr:hypothetical protein JVT61DRAFT_4733 [Boletus reticuloceps]